MLHLSIIADSLNLNAQYEEYLDFVKGQKFIF